MTTPDITNTRVIFGPNRDSVRGKTTRMALLLAMADYISVPWLIRKQCRDIIISADLFFADKIPFLVALSCRLQFATAIATEGRGKKTLVNT